MRVAKELAPTIVSTTVVNDYSDLPSSGPYDLEQRYVYNNKVYEVVADPNTSDLPDAGVSSDPPTWALLGWSNQYRMFKDGADSVSTEQGEIDVVLNYDELVSVMAVFGIEAASIKLTVNDSVAGDVYEETISLSDIGVADWWEYYFLPYDNETIAVFEGIPPYADADYHLEAFGATGSDDVSVGRVVAGYERDIGITLYNTSVSLKDYSIKTRDGFGNLTITPRRTIKLVDFDVHVFTVNVDSVVRLFKDVISEPALFIGEADFSSTVVFGLIADVSQGITSPVISDLTLRVEEF